MQLIYIILVKYWLIVAVQNINMSNQKSNKTITYILVMYILPCAHKCELKYCYYVLN